MAGEIPKWPDVVGRRRERRAGQLCYLIFPFRREEHLFLCLVWTIHVLALQYGYNWRQLQTRCISFFGGTNDEGSCAKIKSRLLHLSKLHISCIKGGEALSFLETRSLGPWERYLDHEIRHLSLPVNSCRSQAIMVIVPCLS